MTDEEFTEAFVRLRPIVADIIGFHGLAEDEGLSPSPLKRMEWEARVYAAGVELAIQVTRLANALDRPER